MKLDRLTLVNFRQYCGQQEIAFSKHEKRPVTLIHGINGAGKTSMFTAINWCLYGKEAIDNIGELVCKHALVDAMPGQLVECTAELAFTHAGHRYVMQRKIGAVRQIDGRIHTHDNEEVTLHRIGADGQAVRENSPLSTINAILPANVRSYFLFDGEKIDGFARPEAASEVKEAIYLVLRLEVLDRARIHLRQLARQYRKEIVALSGDASLTKLEEAAESAENTLQTATERLDEVTREIALADRHITEIDEQLSGMETVRQLQKERKTAERNLKQERRQLEETIENLQANASRSYLLMAAPILDQALSILDDKREKGQIPSNIRQQFIQDLLNNFTCICGRPLPEHADEYKQLQSLMLNTVSGKLETAVLDTNTTLHTLKRDCATLTTELDRLLREHTQVQERIKHFEGEISDLEFQLKDSPQEDVSNLEKQRQQFHRDNDRNKVELGRLQERIEKAQKEIERISAEIRQTQKSNAQANHLAAKQELAESAAQAIDATYDAHADAMRRAIETRTNEIFRTLIWKSSHFQEIRLDESYDLQVIDRYGMAARPELSAGERQVLSLSFITAMAQVSGEEAPLVMDTPFGRLSSHHRHNITANLPQLASQLILFVTDEEFNDQMRTNLKPFIGAEYHLNFDDLSSVTTIEGK